MSEPEPSLDLDALRIRGKREFSMAEQFAQLGDDGIEELLSVLDEDEIRGLLTSWDFWARPSQKEPEGDWKEWLLCTGRGFGKALALDTPIPTPTGWTSMGAVRVGDTVFDEAGQPCSVTATFDVPEPERAYRVSFSDGSHIDACGDHQWATLPTGSRGALGWATTARVQTTSALHATQADGHVIPATAPLDLPAADLPGDPYDLGRSLALDAIRETLRGSIDQRRAALAGVLDRVGFTDPLTGFRSIDSDDTRLLVTVTELVRTLGYTPVPGARWTPQTRERVIRAVTPIDPEPMRCITVDSPNSLFLAGAAMTPTHNTRTESEWGYRRVEQGSRAGFLLGRTYDAVRDVMINGPSGILAIAEAHGTPWTYRPTTGHVVTHTGSTFKIHTSEEPDQLRGPEYDTGVIDEFACLPAGTDVLMADGTVTPIERVLPGDLVVTRSGPRKVRNSWSNGFAPVFEIQTSCGRVVRATGNHRFAVPDGGWVRADEIVEGAKLLTCSAVTTLQPTEVLGISRLDEPEEVFDLEVDGEPEFVANGLVVHNSLKATVGVDGLTAFDNARFALRAVVPGLTPRAILATTPKRVKSVRQMEMDALDPKKRIVVTRGSMMENLGNLDPSFIEGIISKYGGTALGEQEIEGKLARTVEGASFSEIMFATSRIVDTRDLPELSRPVIAVDPSVGDGTGDECGIVVCAASAGTMSTEIQHGALTVIKDVRHAYVLEDASLSADPDGWANQIVSVATRFGVREVIAEGNNGGQVIASLLKARDPSLRVEIVHARVGKEARAEPVAALFSQGRAHLVGEFPDLEDQCSTFIPGKGQRSPDRMDAMVWGVTHLLPDVNKKPARKATPPSAFSRTVAP